MKVEFSDWDYGAEVLLTPETLKEIAGLLRIARNASSKKAEIYLSFRDDTPFCSIVIYKRKPSVQIKSVKPE